MADTVMIRAKRPAMGCEFELVLRGESRDYLLEAAEEAFAEVVRLEEQMSVFIPDSEISRMNAAASNVPVRIDPRLFDLLLRAAQLSHETDGAFDITAGALSQLWNSASDAPPTNEEIAAVLSRTGMSLIDLDEREYTVWYREPGVRIDLGALGKGHAVRQVADLLVELGIVNGLISSGNSSVYAIGSPMDDDAWTLGIRNPVDRSGRITAVRLNDQALSTSGSHERFVEIGGVRYSHIIDPRNGRPASGLLAASAITADPAEGDALSTAFFIMGIEKTITYCDGHPGVGAVLVTEGSSGPEVISVGVVHQTEVEDS